MDVFDALKHCALEGNPSASTVDSLFDTVPGCSTRDYVIAYFYFIIGEYRKCVRVLKSIVHQKLAGTGTSERGHWGTVTQVAS